MRKFVSGVLVGFGSALSVAIYTAWDLLLACLDSEYLIVGEAKVIRAAEIATHIGTALGILLIIAGLSVALFGRIQEKRAK